MTDTVVDTNVLLDLIQPNAPFAEWSLRALETASTGGRLILTQAVYAELAAGFRTVSALEHVLSGRALVREELPWAAAFQAGRAFREYRARGGARTSTLPDFFIGAHAQVRGYALLTRDARRYRTYFPDVRLIAPD